MRKFSYLFAALLMSVLSLTSKAGTTVQDFSLFSMEGGTTLVCPDGWSYFNGSAGSITLSNNAMPGETGLFYGSSSSPYVKYGYLVTEAKAGTISLEVAIPAPIAAAASGAFVSVSTMDGASGPVGTLLKKWTVDDALSTALCTFVTVEVELPEDGYIGITGKNICIHKYTNTFAGGEGGDDEWTVAASEDFNSVVAGTYNNNLTAEKGWPAGWYILAGSNWDFQGAAGGVDGSNCIKWGSSNSTTSTAANSYIITQAKAGKVSFMFKPTSNYILSNSNCHIVLAQMEKDGDTFSVKQKLYTLDPSNYAQYGINADNFVKVEFEIDEDMWIGLNAATFFVDNYENLVQGGNTPAPTEVTDTENFNSVVAGTYNNNLTAEKGWPAGWYILAGSNWDFQGATGGVDGSNCIKWGSSNSTTSTAANSYIITQAKAGKVSFMFKPTSNYILSNSNCHIVLAQMEKDGDTFSVKQKLYTLDPSNYAQYGINADNFVKVEFEIDEDMWIGLNAATFFVDNYENTYMVGGESKTYSVSGTVKDANGNPLVGATVKLTNCPDVTTPQDGTFSFTDLKEGPANLMVSLAGYDTYVELLTVDSDITRDIVLNEQVSTINFWFNSTTNSVDIRTANVTLYDGETPVAGNENIEGRLETFDVNYAGSIRQEEHFVYPVTIKGALDPDKVYTLKVSVLGYEETSIDIYCVVKNTYLYFTAGKSVLEHQYLKPKEVNFAATVLNTEQEFVAGATVTLTYGANTRTANYVADSQTYVISKIPAPELIANTAVASCVVPGMHPIANQTIEFDGENIEVLFVAVPYEATVVKGSVTRANDENTVVAGATVTLLNGEEKVQETVTDAEGAYKFTLNGAIAESYTLTVTAPYYTDYSAEITPEEEATNNVNVAMEPVMYSFTATVADEENVAIEGAKVTLGGKELTTDEHGDFVGSVWAGDVAGNKTVEVVASAEGYDSETYELTYAEGETEASHAFTLKLTQYSFIVTVTDDEHNTLDNAIVKVSDAEGTDQTVVNEGNGVYAAYWTSKNVPAGELTATVMCEGYDSYAVTFDFSETNTVTETVVLEEHLYSMTVTVLNSNDNDAAVLDATVIITCDEVPDYSQEADPQGDGTYVFEAGAVSAKGLTFTATVSAPGLEVPFTFNFTLDDGNVEKTARIAIVGVNAVFAGEMGAKNLAGKIYVNGEAQIFTIDGKLVRVVRTQGVEEIEGLQPGLYIVAGEKMIVK